MTELEFAGKKKTGDEAEAVIFLFFFFCECHYADESATSGTFDWPWRSEDTVIRWYYCWFQTLTQCWPLVLQANELIGIDAKRIDGDCDCFHVLKFKTLMNSLMLRFRVLALLLCCALLFKVTHACLMCFFLRNCSTKPFLPLVPTEDLKDLSNFCLMNWDD